MNFHKLILILTVSFLASSLSAGKSDMKKRLKIFYMHHFTKYTVWDPSAYKNDKTPFIIAVLGQDPFGSLLNTMMRGKKINGRRIRILRYESVDDVDFAHILFISNSLEGDMKEILSKICSKNMLTISDADNFVKNGGMIGFVEVEDKMRFSINRSEAKAKNIRFRSKLLRLAQKIM